ncbi:hypothetical protein BO221_48975 [Archangium sp. Cb G35]|nr:hypothetical protein BO221_48975 [Archangium sp. Cb G35]
MCDGLHVFLAQRVLSTESAHPALGILQHSPCLASLPGIEMKRLHVEAGNVDTHAQIAEAELLQATKPPAKLLPWHPVAVGLGEDGTCDDALHREALSRGLCLLQPAILQLQEFALASLVGRLLLEQLQVVKVEFLAEGDRMFLE